MKRVTRRALPAVRLAHLLQDAHLTDYVMRRPHHRPPRTESDDRAALGIIGWLAVAHHLIRQGVRLPPEGET